MGKAHLLNLNLYALRIVKKISEREIKNRTVQTKNVPQRTEHKKGAESIISPSVSNFLSY